MAAASFGMIDLLSYARVAKWQTRRLQVPVPARAWGFKSPLAHVSKSPAFWSGIFLASCVGLSRLLAPRKRAKEESHDGDDEKYEAYPEEKVQGLN
jgi:hypothetical protein